MSDESNYLEEMEYFFDKRADGYDVHMENTITSFADFYSIISEPINQNKDSIEILDLGCGTGIELQYLFNRNPKVKITCIDLSEKMLLKLKEKYIDKIGQIQLIKGSYLHYKIRKNYYDYIISVMTLHHLIHEKKLNLYKNIWSGLKENSYYIEGDYIVSENEEESFLKKYQEEILKLKISQIKNDYHIDIPFSVKIQKKLLKEANFYDIEIIFQNEKSAIIKAKK